MSVFSKHILSGAVNGKPIELSTAGVVVHTAGAGTGTIDEINVYALNTATNSHVVTVKYGATTSDSTWTETVPPKSGLYHILPGLIINNALALTCYATGSVKVVGWVNRIAT
jgi:hypothetical protein